MDISKQSQARIDDLKAMPTTAQVNKIAMNIKNPQIYQQFTSSFDGYIKNYADYAYAAGLISKADAKIMKRGEVWFSGKITTTSEGIGYYWSEQIEQDGEVITFPSESYFETQTLNVEFEGIEYTLNQTGSGDYLLTLTTDLTSAFKMTISGGEAEFGHIQLGTLEPGTYDLKIFA